MTNKPFLVEAGTLREAVAMLQERGYARDELQKVLVEVALVDLDLLADILSNESRESLAC